MLNLRIYRAAFAPLLVALIVVAFSLESRPRGMGTTLAPDAFDGAAASATAERLADRHPRRPTGGAADVLLAGHVETKLRAALLAESPAGEGGPAPATVQAFDDRLRTAEGTRTVRTVLAERPGVEDRRILVVADRSETPRHASAAAQLSGTAALLELGRVFSGRTTRRTLTFASISGGPAGARALARRLSGPVDAALVLGDLASTALGAPQVLSWSNGHGRAPQPLVRTVAAAVRTETATDPGGGRALVQWARLAVPVAPTAQGELLEAGIPAVMLQRTGEQGPPAASEARPAVLAAYGRAALRSISALDEGRDVPTRMDTGITIRGQVVPEWAVSLLVAALLAPVLLASVDGLARVRRRRHAVAPWVRWVLAAAGAFLLAAVFALVLRLTGLVAAPGAPVAGATEPRPAALVAVVLVLVLGWVALRPLALRALGVRGSPADPGAAAAVALVLSITAVAVWAGNPHAAALLVPALHLWVLAAAPDLRLPRVAGVLLVLLGLLPLGLVVAYYGAALDLGPVELAWSVLLAVAGGHVDPLAVVATSLILGCAAAALTIVLRRPAPAAEPPPVTVRGPLSYAGPGSLGGTESALRR